MLSLLGYLGVGFLSAADGLAYPCPESEYSDPSAYGPDGLPTFRPLIIAHRGASGMYPEHTALGYRKAAEQGADLLECDLAITKVGKTHQNLAHYVFGVYFKDVCFLWLLFVSEHKTYDVKYQ